MIYAKGSTVSYNGSTRELQEELSVAMAKVTQGCGALICMGSAIGMTRRESEEIFMQHVIDGARAQLEELRKRD